MRNNIWQKRVPNFLVFLLLIASVGITSVFLNNTTIFLTRASPSNLPNDVQITNITDASFTVSYQTSDKVLGVLSYGDDNTTNQTAQDEKDIEAKSVSPYTTHYFNVKNLKPQIKYFFSIVSGPDKFLNNGTPYEVSTAPSINSSNSSSIVSGSVLLPDGSNTIEGIIYIKNDYSQPLSTPIKNDGSYSIDLSNLRSKDLTSFIDLSSKPVLSMRIVSQNLISNITFSSDANILPPITMSQNYDFTQNDNPVSLNQPIATNEANIVSFPKNNIKVSEDSPQILTPKKNEEFIDQQPLFKGTASPGANINIIINSDNQIQATAKANSNGVWTYRPTTPLSPGEHTLTVTAPDQYGILQRFTQKFTVYAAGTQVSESATPSATPKITLAPTNTPTLIPTQTPTPTPTIALTPTPIPTLTIAIPTVFPSPGDSSAVSVEVLGAAATIGGILLFILTKIVL